MYFSFVRYNAESIRTTTTSKDTIVLNNVIIILNCSQTKIISLILDIEIHHTSVFPGELLKPMKMNQNTFKFNMIHTYTYMHITSIYTIVVLISTKSFP